MPIQLVETTIWIAGNYAAPKLSSLKASTSLLFRRSDTARSWIQVDWKFVPPSEWRISCYPRWYIKYFLETYNYRNYTVLSGGEKTSSSSTFDSNIFIFVRESRRLCSDHFRTKYRECSRMFSTFQQEGKPRWRGCYGVHRGYHRGCRGRVLLFEGLYTSREGFIALLATFSHCLDWVLRGDGSWGSGMEARY